MSNVEIALSKLHKYAQITAGARFNAARRLEKRDWFSTFSIAMFSAVGVGIAVVQKIYTFRPGSSVDNYLTALSVFIGLFVIVISLIEWGVKARLNAETFKQNAEDLTYFKHKLQLRLAKALDGILLSHEEADQFNEEYEKIKRSCPVNHETVDKNLYLAQNRTRVEFFNEAGKAEFGHLGAIWVRIDSLLSGIRYFLVFWLVIVALLGVAIFKY